MKQKLEARAFEQVAPLLQPGEQTVVATRAMVGKFSGSRLGALATQALASQGGVMGASLAAKGRQFVVVTDRRLIFLAQSFMGGPGKKVTGEVSREQVSVAEVKMGLVSLVRVAFGAEGDGVALTFPRSDKKNAEAFAEALQRTPVA